MKRLLGALTGAAVLFTFIGCASSSNAGKTAPVGEYKFDTTITYQTMDGVGMGLTYYTNWLNYQSPSVREAEFDAFFSDAKIPLIRFKNEFEYKKENEDVNMATIKMMYDAAEKRLGQKPIILMCCWSPKASLKSNDSINCATTIDGNAVEGTLKQNEDGTYMYKEYAQWWTRAVQYYLDHGITIDYVSIQNEVDWPASYDGCLFSAVDDGENAVYSEAFLAVYDAFQKAFGDKAPLMLGPEAFTADADFNKSYTDPIVKKNPKALAGVAHHLYDGGVSTESSTEGAFKGESTNSPNSYNTSFKNLYKYYPDVKRWQTEFFRGHAIQTVELINNALTIEQAHAYIYWDGFWFGEVGDSFERDGMITAIDKQFDNWEKRAAYYAIRHFSEYIRPGYTRIESVTGNNKIASSAYISPDSSKVAVVLINTSGKEVMYHLNASGYTIASKEAYQSVFGKTAKSEETCWNKADISADDIIVLPAYSATTIAITGNK